MGRYCLESTDSPEGTVVLHEQSCPWYDLASLLAAGRITDIGTHDDVLCALHFLREEPEPVSCCLYCCPLCPPAPRTITHKARHGGNPDRL